MSHSNGFLFVAYMPSYNDADWSSLGHVIVTRHVRNKKEPVAPTPTVTSSLLVMVYLIDTENHYHEKMTLGEIVSSRNENFYYWHVYNAK